MTAAPGPSDFRVTLLGTSSPLPNPERFGPSTLVEAGNQKLVFDAGRGVPIRLGQLNIPLGRIDALFLTHYHSDHVAGIADIWLTGWIGSKYGQRTTPFHVLGPVGARSLMANLEKAYSLDISTRLEDEGLSPAGIAANVEEFTQEGVVFEKDGVRVSTFNVNHGEHIHPSVGYRVDYQQHAVVISGDTRYDENLIAHAQRADLLIHEVAAIQEGVDPTPYQRKILGHHTQPKEAGQVFAKVRPKLAVYTHIVLLSGATVPAPTIDQLAAYTRKTYDGPLEIGADLMSFEIGDAVQVHRPVAAGPAH